MADALHTIYPAKTIDRRLLLIASPTSIWQFDGQVWTDVTGTDVDDGTILRWTGGWLTGVVCLANRKAVRTFRPGLDLIAQPMIYNGGTGQPGDQTWESKGYSAQVFRPFRNYLFAGNLNWNGDDYPSRIQWCDTVEPGQVPLDWVPREDNRAGDVDLAETPGSVIDMALYRESLLILKRDSIWTCSFTGDIEQPFAFRRLETAKGIHTTDCVVEHGGLAWCQGIEDIFICDGNTIESILWGKIKKTWLADRDPDKAQYAFTVLDPVNEEMLFFYTSVNAPSEYDYPDKALVVSLRGSNPVFFRDYELECPHAKTTLDLVRQSSANLVFHALDRSGDRLLDLEAAPDRIGAAVSAQWRRSALFSDPAHDFVQVDRTKLQITGQAATLKLGDQIALDAPITWRGDFTVDPQTDYKTDARANGQLIAYQVDVQTLADWQASNINLLVQKSGERG